MRHLRWLVALIPLLALLIVPKAHAAVYSASLNATPTCVVVGGTVAITVSGSADPGDEVVVQGSVVPSGSPPSYIVLTSATAGGTGNYSVQFFYTASAIGNFDVQARAGLSIAGPFVISNLVTIRVVAAIEECGPPPPPPPSGPSAPTFDDVIFTQDVIELNGTVLTVDVGAWNIGVGEGDVTGYLSYDPASVKVLDAWTEEGRDNDWVSARDDEQGTLTLSFGTIQPEHSATITVRFLLRDRSVSSAIRVVREDLLDHANPVFLLPGEDPSAPLEIDAAWLEDGRLWLGGMGFRPEESLALWGNTADGEVIFLADWPYSNDDADGTLDLALWLPDANIISVVVRGQLSGATGVAPLE